MVQPYGPLQSHTLFKIVTPLILVAGLLFFAVHAFSSTLINSQQQSDQYHDLLAFRQGPLAAILKSSAGLDRPGILYYNDNLLSYAEWSSTITINGSQQELWNNAHQYRIDEKNHTIYNTINGATWQLIQRITLINNHTISVTFSLNTQLQTNTKNLHYVLNIVHIHNFWLTQQFQSNTFVGQVMLGDPETLQRQLVKERPILLGTLSLKVQSTLPQAPTLLISDAHSIMGVKQSWQWNRSLTTVYTVDNPPPSQLIALGTETITFQPSIHQSGTL